MDVNLTQGAIMRMRSDNFSSEEWKPVLQVIDLKPVRTQHSSATKRYCVIVSDGSRYNLAVLATQQNELVDSGKLQNGSIVRLTQFIANLAVADRMIIAIVELDILKDKCDLIGEPVPAPKYCCTQSATGESGVTSENSQPNPVKPSLYNLKLNPHVSSVYPKDVSTWKTKCTIIESSLEEIKREFVNVVESSLEELKKEFELVHEKIKQDEEKIGSLIAEKEETFKLLEDEQKKKELVERISDSLKTENECVRSMLFKTAKEAFDNAVGQLKILNPELKDKGASSERVARDGKICVIDEEGNFVPCTDVHPPV